MLRLIHNQASVGAILIDDIDDGLPNKTAHRLGSSADPKAYVRDGYANKPKQPCYIPYHKPANSAIAGYIDLDETERVQLSAGKGKIFKHALAGHITVVSFVASDLAAPTITTAEIDAGTHNLILTGTNFLSVAPNYTTIRVLGANPVTLTQTQLVGGSISDTQIVIPAALVPAVAETNTVTVTSDDQTTAPHAIGAEPAITLAELNRPALGDLTITGTNFDSATSSVTIQGAGAVGPLTKAAILAAGGVAAFNDTTIVIPGALVPLVVEDTSLAVVSAEGFSSAATKLLIRPAVSVADLDNPGAGDLTITGTGFLSTVVGDASLEFTGTGAKVVTKAAVEALGGIAAWTDTSIVIPAGSAPLVGVAVATTSVSVTAEGLVSTAPVAVS